MTNQIFSPGIPQTPFMVKICSIGPILIGISFMVGAIIMAFLLPIMLNIFPVALAIIVGCLSIVAGFEYWSLKALGTYVHLLCLGEQLLLMPFVRVIFPLLLFGLAISFAAFLIMAVYLRIKIFVILTVVSISFVLASYTYQQKGPEIGVYGNACVDQPNGLCKGPILGAGFPFQYVIDNLGTSVREQLGMEDNFRLIPFLLDILFYNIIFYGGIKLARYYSHSRKEKAFSRPASKKARDDSV
jgi:hypothetical protein